MSQIGLVCALLIALGAAERAQLGSDAPTFRSGVDAVTLDVFVTDATGRAVTDLTVDDFELFEKGERQAITAFTAVEIPLDEALGRAESWPVDPDTAINTQPPGRTYVFALDETFVTDALRTRAFLRTFLEQFFGPNDLGAVVLVGRGLVTDGQSFTGSPHLLLKAVDKFMGGTPAGCPPPVSYARVGDLVLPYEPGESFLVRQRFMSLRTLVDSLASVPGNRKTVLYFSNCVGFDMQDVVDYRGGVLSLVATDAHAVLATATRANVVFYAIDPQGLSGGPKNMNVALQMRSLASATGGFALGDSNNFLEAFARVRAESSLFYSIGFNSAYTTRDGRFVPVEVRVKRPGLKVRARSGYVAPLGKARSLKREDVDVSPALEALASPVRTSGVALRVFAAPFRTERDPATAIVIDIDPDTLGLSEQDGTLTGDLEVSYVATDARNRAFPGGRHGLSLSLKPDEYQRARAHGLRMASSLSLPPGQYQLRVAVSGVGRTGSVIADLTVPDFGKSPFGLSGVALAEGTARQGVSLRPTPGTDARGKPVKCNPPRCVVRLTRSAPTSHDPLHALPHATADRTFDPDDELVVYAEAYEKDDKTPHQVTFEVILEDANGRRRVLLAEERPTTGRNSKWSVHPFNATASLRDVTPGRYILRVAARSGAASDRRAERAIPIEVK